MTSPLFPTHNSLQPSRPSLLAGLIFVILLAVISISLAHLSWFSQAGISPLTIGIVIGMLMGNLATAGQLVHLEAGVEFAKSRILKTGIILLGFHFTFSEIIGLGWRGVLIDILIMTGVLALAYVTGRKLLKLDRHTSLLIGAGSAICGAAAILATAPVIKAKADSVIIAVATVVIFGTTSMFVYPFIGAYLGLSDHVFGIYAGSTIHEVAQVVAAASAVSPDAAQVAVLEKMIRVMLLAPFLIVLAMLPARSASAHATSSLRVTLAQMPWFAILFVLVIGFNSLVKLNTVFTHFLLSLDDLLLTMAMVALGLKTHLKVVRQAGIKPLILGLVLFVFLVGGGAVINQLLF